jgi:hypothetical protein
LFLIFQKTNFKFSFGVVLWELLTCRVPWRGSGYKFPQQILKAVAQGERPQATPEELEQAPHGFLKLMERCWDGKASKRPTFNKCLRQLRRIASASINQPKLQRGSSPGQTGGKVQVAKLRKQLAKLSTDVTALAEKKRFREAAAVQEKYEAVEKLLATALALTCENCGKSEGLAGGSMFCMLCGHTRSEVSVQEAAKRKQEAAEKKGAEARKRRQERRKRALEAARQAREEKQAAMKLAQEKKGMGTIAEDSEEEEDEDEEEEEEGEEGEEEEEEEEEKKGTYQPPLLPAMSTAGSTSSDGELVSSNSGNGGSSNSIDDAAARPKEEEGRRGAEESGGGSDQKGEQRDGKGDEKAAPDEERGEEAVAGLFVPETTSTSLSTE